MAINIKTVLKYTFLFLMGMAVLYLAFKNQDLNKLWSEIKSANIFWVATSLFIVLLAHFLRALRWQMLYHSISYKVKLSNAYHAVFIGYLANLALPRFGEIARCSVVQGTERVPMFASIGTVITERLFDVLILLLTGLALIIFQYNIVIEFLQETIYTNFLKQIFGFNYLLLAIAILLFILIAIVVFFLRRKFSSKFLRIIVSLRTGFASFKSLKNKTLFLVYTFCIWILYFLSMYFAFYSLQSTNGLGVNVAYTAFVFSGFAMVAPVQGGIGVFHWMVAQALVLHAVQFKEGLAYATIIHSSQLLLVLVLGSLSLFIVLTKRKRIE